MMSRPASRHGQQGFATLAGAIAFILILTVMVSISVSMSTTDISDTALQHEAIEALLLAESGIERTSLRFGNDIPCPDLVPDPVQTLGRGSFQLLSAVDLGYGLCRINVLATVANAQRQVQADIYVDTHVIAWAAGHADTILAWDVDDWWVESSGGNWTNDVYCVSEEDCWTAGMGGGLMRWDGYEWLPVESGTSGAINAITCMPGDPNDCYLVTSAGQIRRWNGSSWSLAHTATVALNAIHCMAGHCYAVGQKAEIWHYNGVSWTLEEIPGKKDYDLNGVYCFDATECWGVGDKTNKGYHLVRRSGSNWTTEYLNVNPRQILRAIHCNSTTDCWAVGDKMTYLHMDASGWSLHSSGTGTRNLYAIDCRETDDCLAVGTGGAAESWNGSSWKVELTGVNNSMRGVAFRQ